MINEIKEVSKEDLQDEILRILFNYLLEENKQLRRLIKVLRKKEN